MSDESRDGWTVVSIVKSVGRLWEGERIGTVFFGILGKGGGPHFRKRKECFVFFWKEAVMVTRNESIRTAVDKKWYAHML